VIRHVLTRAAAAIAHIALILYSAVTRRMYNALANMRNIQRQRHFALPFGRTLTTSANLCADM